MSTALVPNSVLRGSVPGSLGEQTAGWSLMCCNCVCHTSSFVMQSASPAKCGQTQREQAGVS